MTAKLAGSSAFDVPRTSLAKIRLGTTLIPQAPTKHTCGVARPKTATPSAEEGRGATELAPEGAVRPRPKEGTIRFCASGALSLSARQRLTGR